ncbi:CocE/NonD family hydrolase [Kineothrix sedimenti]|uniref:CocE/NonD family hydrolase n=1 Tax=Kineothrix sedimenti TaxID=3123317 RepID=A0ABZ3EWP9_9FIRM
MEQSEIKKADYICSLYTQLDAPCTHKIGDVREILLPMRDGVCLKTDVHFPKDVKSAPVILMRCCYTDMERELQVHAQEYCKRGYIFVVQWCRGIGGSQGKWEPNVNERLDGIDTVNWIKAQDFAEAIGYWGNSYLAYTGWCMADQVSGKVASMYLGVYGTDRYTSAYKDGLFRQDILTAWAMQNAGTPIEADYLESCRFKPQMKVDEKLWGTKLPWYKDWICNESRESDYWSSGLWKELKEIPSRVSIPIFIREGWYDHHLGSALVSYQSLPEETREHCVLQIGPWNHSYGIAVAKHDLSDLEDDSVSSPFLWFEQTLRKRELPEKKLSFYVIGQNKWESLNNYPVICDKIKTFYLAVGKEGQGALSLREEAGEDARIEYEYDPENPVFSHGAESLFHTTQSVGSLVQPLCGYRDDVISFVSPSIEKELFICGRINVKLHVSSDAQDTAFTAKISEVFPDGEAVNIRGSITTLAYRNNASTAMKYMPGNVVEINLEMWDIAWKLQEGSCLRLDVSSSDFPQYAVHSNYAGNWAKCMKTKKARQNIYMGKNYQSVIELPLLD